MYPFILKYRQVVINAVIFIFLIFASFGFHEDFFLGAAAGAALIALGASIGDLKSKRNEKELSEEKMSIIND